MSKVSMREMLEAGVHFGHQTRYWNPGMEPYLFGQRNKIHIINLEKTLPLYNEAINFVSKLASKKATILFVGTKRAAQSILADEAKRCEMPYVNRRWLGGLLTNFKTVRGSINRLKEIETMQTDGSFEHINKKEQLMYARELEKLEANLSGIKNMKGIPDALFIIDVGYENIAVSEAVKLGIPVIGIVDSNNSPKNVDYVIPGNDDATRSISLYTKGMADAVIEGRGSVAYLDDTKDKDELVEINELGEPIITAKGEKVKVTQKKIFDATFWICIASLFYFWSILFLVVVYAGILYYLPKLKNWLIPPIAVLAVAALTQSFHIITYDQFYTFSEWFQWNYFDYSNYQNPKILIPLSIILALTFWTLVKFFAVVNKASVSMKPSLNLVLLSLLTAVAVAVFAPTKDGSELIFFFVPLSIIASIYFDQKSDKLFREVLLAFLILMPLSIPLIFLLIILFQLYQLKVLSLRKYIFLLFFLLYR
mgnify:CR=1 FL=1